MVTLAISCFTPNGFYRECILSCRTLDTGLEKLSDLVRSGWRLLSVKAFLDDTATWLPVQALDGQPIAAPLQALQREWEECLQVH